MPDIQPVLIFADGVPVSAADPLPVTGGGGGGTSDQGKSNGDATDGWSVRLTDGAAFIVPAKTGQLPAALGATTAAGSVSVGIATDQLSTLATAAKQDTGNASLSSIDGKVATAANQTTANSSLATIATQQTDGSQKTQVTSSALPTGAATAAKQPTLGTAGVPSADVISVQGVVGGTAQPISATSLPLPTGAATSALQGGGLPAALVGGRLDSNIGAWLGSTAPSVGQKAAASSLPVVLASDQVGSAGTAASNVLTVQGIASMTPVQVSQATAANLNATVVGGAANAAAVSGNPVLVAGYDGTNARTIRTDSTGSIFAAGGASYNTNGVNETRTVRTGAGVLIRLVINPGTSSTFICYDNTAGSGTVLCALTTGSAGGNGYSVEIGATFSTGLTYVSTGGCNVTLVYRAF